MLGHESDGAGWYSGTTGEGWSWKSDVCGRVEGQRCIECSTISVYVVDSIGQALRKELGVEGCHTHVDMTTVSAEDEQARR